MVRDAEVANSQRELKPIKSNGSRSSISVGSCDQSGDPLGELCKDWVIVLFCVSYLVVCMTMLLYYTENTGQSKTQKHLNLSAS